MNRYSAGLVLAAMALTPATAAALTATYEIQLDNPLNVNRSDAPVAIDLSALAPQMSVVAATVTDGDTALPSQLDDLDGDGTADELAFTADIRAKGRRTLRLTLSDQGEQADYPARTYATLMLHGRKKGESVAINEVEVPGGVNFYNMCYGHGPMFESELTGYRVYFNEKQTLDPYGKFIPRLELQESRFYPDDDMLARGFGDDVLLAGNSCGIGAFKGWDGEQAVHIAPVRSRAMRVLASGPVRAIVECEVRGWESPDGTLDLTNRYTLWAGHRDVQVDALFPAPLGDETFATGVERVMGDSTVCYTDHESVVASWGHHWPVNDTVKYAKETIGIATCVPPRHVRAQRDDASNVLLTLQAPGERRITYHTMFTSAKEGRHPDCPAIESYRWGYGDARSWFDSLAAWRRELEHPVTVTITPLSRK